MPKLTDDPKVQELIAKERNKALKEERARVTAYIKDEIESFTQDAELEPAVVKDRRRVLTRIISGGIKLKPSA